MGEKAVEEAVKLVEEIRDWRFKLFSACEQVDRMYGELVDMRHGLEIISGNIIELFRQLETKKASDLPLRSQEKGKL